VFNTVAYVGFNELVPLDSQGLCPVFLGVLFELSDASLRDSFRGPHYDFFDLTHEARLVVGKG
jgi:hypothetical protein